MIEFECAAYSESGEELDAYAVFGKEALGAGVASVGGFGLWARRGLSGCVTIVATCDDSQSAALRSAVLSGELDAALCRSLPGAVWRTDRTRFAEELERARETDDSLTPHQQDRFDAVGDTDEVHLRAPAGAGKTRWVLHVAQRALRSDEAATALFVARNPALALFAVRCVCGVCSCVRQRNSQAVHERFVWEREREREREGEREKEREKERERGSERRRWLVTRERSPEKRASLLRRLRVLHEPRSARALLWDDPPHDFGSLGKARKRERERPWRLFFSGERKRAKSAVVFRVF